MGSFLEKPIVEMHTSKGASGSTLNSDGTVNKDFIAYGFTEMQGWRSSMEDSHFHCINWGGKGYHLFGVFDGHGGDQAAKVVAAHLPRRLENSPEWIQFVKNGKNDKRDRHLLESMFKNEFIRTDLQMNGRMPTPADAPLSTAGTTMDTEDKQAPSAASSTNENSSFVTPKKKIDTSIRSDSSGCTAIVCLVTPTLLVFANAGDSRAVLGSTISSHLQAASNASTMQQGVDSATNVVTGSDSQQEDEQGAMNNNVAGTTTGLLAPPPLTPPPMLESIFATKDHKPNDQIEKDRIENADGHVAYNRVNGELAVSRAFGDFNFKTCERVSWADQRVSVLPDVTIHERTLENHGFIVLACDGIWDVMSNSDCLHAVSSWMSSGENDLGNLVEDVVQSCLMKGSKDNMSCMLICLPAGVRCLPVKRNETRQRPVYYVEGMDNGGGNMNMNGGDMSMEDDGDDSANGTEALLRDLSNRGNMVVMNHQ